MDPVNELQDRVEINLRILYTTYKKFFLVDFYKLKFIEHDVHAPLGVLGVLDEFRYIELVIVCCV